MPLQPAVDRVPADDLSAIIQSAARRHGIDPDILRAVGMQETGLGHSAVYDPVSGLSRTPGNRGHGIWQLDPTSGASQAELDRAAKDPAFAADRAASMLSGFIKNHNGDLKAALEAYNGGGKGYADSVLAYMPRNRRGRLDLLGDTVPPLPQGATPINQPAPPLPKGATPLNGPALPKGARPIRRQASLADKIKLAPSEAEQLANTLFQHGLVDYRAGARGLADAATNPTTILNAVLGAPQRFVAGALSADQQHGGARNTSLLDEAKGAVYGVFHPNDQSVQQRAEQSVNFPKAKPNAQTPPGLQSILTPAGAIEHGMSDPKVQNFAGDLGFQTATDPLTYLMGPIRTGGEAGLEALRNVGTAALRSGRKDLQNFAGTFIPHADVQAAFTPKGKAAVVGIRNSQDTVAQRMGHEDAQLLKKHKDEIKRGNVPDDVRQRLLREAYVYGTPEMRKQAVSFGYKPTADESKVPPEGVLHYTLKPDYFPHVINHKMPEEYQSVGKAYNIKPNAKFEKQQTSTQLPLDPLASMEYRLQSGRNIIRHRMIQKRIANETGLGTTVGGQTINANPANIADHVHNLKAAQDILDGTQGVSGVKGFDWLKHISNIGRDTLIGANPLPHMKNIGVLGYLSGGVPVLAKGFYYAVHGVPKNITEWMEKHGAATHFALTSPDTYSLGARALGPIRGKNAEILDRFDTGIRAATYERVKREYPNLSPYEQAEKINEDIGAYKDSPAYVEALRKFAGAQFPQWHGYIVPTAVGRAALKNPQRVETMVRAQNDTNQDLIGKNAGYGLDFGGPVNEFGSLTNTPGEMAAGEKPSYFTSPSIMGPGSIVTGKTSQAQSFDPPGGDLASQVIPYYSIIAPQFTKVAPIIGNPYNSKAPPNVRSIAAFFAAYPKAEQSAREAMIRNFMQQGMNRFSAERQAQRIFSALYKYRR